MDRFQEVAAFLAVVEAGGFSAAARRSGDTQSGLSKAVSALERRLGAMLLNRSTRSVTLTDQGQRYYERMRPLLDEMDEADGEASRNTQDVPGLIRIATAATFGRLHVLPLIPDLLARHPGLRVDLVLSDAVRDLVEDRIDLAIRAGAAPEPDTVARRVAETPLVCVGARRYFERHGTPRTPAELADHNCLVYGGFESSPASWPFTGPQGPFSVPVRGTLSSGSVETIRSAVLDGVGIGLFLGASLAGELAGAQVVRILEDYLVETREVSLVWPKRRFVPARVRRVSEFFAEALPPRIAAAVAPSGAGA